MGPSTCTSMTQMRSPRSGQAPASNFVQARGLRVRQARGLASRSRREPHPVRITASPLEPSGAFRAERGDRGLRERTVARRPIPTPSRDSEATYDRVVEPDLPPTCPRQTLTARSRVEPFANAHELLTNARERDRTHPRRRSHGKPLTLASYAASRTRDRVPPPSARRSRWGLVGGVLASIGSCGSSLLANVEVSEWP